MSNLPGVKNHNAKLTDEAVAEIRLKVATGTSSQADLARQFGVTRCCIHAVVHQRTWRHVKQHAALLQTNDDLVGQS
jgi:hypothetical protein